MYMTQSLHRAVRAHPDKIATICGTRRHSYATFGDRVARLAGALRALGVTPGERVGMLSLNSDRYLEFFFGTYWAGGVVNPVNTRWSVGEIAYSLVDCDTRVLIVDDTFAPMVPALRTQAPCLGTIIHAGDGPTPDGALSYESLLTAHQPVPDALRGGHDLAGVFYTGGTTGFPKGVMLSHQALYCNALALIAEGIEARRMVGLHSAPMFHLADHAFTNALAMGGGTHVMVPSFTPVGVAQIIEREQINAAVLVPTMIQLLADSPEAKVHDLSSLELLMYGGSTISEAVIDRAFAIMPQVNMLQCYGMTELAPAATVLGPMYHTAKGRALGKISSAGQPVAIAEIRIVDADDNELPPGEVGEITVRGPGVMQGYWNKPEETAHALRGGWMHTGDGGRMDAEGFVYVVDRIKDMVVTGGENVYSVEVENAVASHPAVLQCAVIGIPDDTWGELVHAVIVPRPGQSVTLDELLAHCKTRIANYKCPRSLELIDKLPMSGAGKILKNVLREAHWQGHSRKV
jgi:acyl-CoA synthetase (AMP-forming)/AMP-acid ligase II